MSQQSIKAAVRARDGHRCVECGMTAEEYRKKSRFLKRLDVHRLAPGSPYSVDGCITTCRQCHKRKHSKSKKRTGRRMFLEVDREVQCALLLRATKEGKSISEILDALIRENLAEEIAEIEAFRKRHQSD